MNINWKSTIVFYSIEAIGHINPIVSIVKELRRRGIRAIILTTRPLNIAPKLLAAGLEVEHCSDSFETISDNDSQQKFKAMLGPLIKKFRLGITDAFKATYALDGAVGKYLTDAIQNHDLVEAKLRSLKPDLIVVDHVIGLPCTTQIAKHWVRVYSGFPSALYSSINDTYVAGLGLKLSEMTPEMKKFELDTKATLREAVKEFWAQEGVQDWESKIELAPTSPYLNFYLGPQELGLEKIPTLKPLPDKWFRLEHTIDQTELTNDFQIPEKLINLPGKLIYFSLGTLVNLDIELINRLLEIFSKSPNRFIVSMGQLHEQVKLHSNMWGKQFIDQMSVLPKVDLFITHTGHNSILEAFYFGVPGLIMLPVFADQFDCAQRVADCGYGIRLNPYECNENELLEAIDRILANESLKESMKNIGLRLRSIKYHEMAANKLEALLMD